MPSNYVIRYVSWSRNAKYLHFSLWQTVEQGPGFVLDVETLKLLEIKLPDSSFMEGEWLVDDDHLIYFVRSHLTGEIELWLLDVTRWSTQMLVSARCDIRFQILGWTSDLYR
jgi:hypothetical protein